MRDRYGRKWYEYIDNRGNRYPAYEDTRDQREVVMFDHPLKENETVVEYVTKHINGDNLSYRDDDEEF